MLSEPPCVTSVDLLRPLRCTARISDTIATTVGLCMDSHYASGSREKRRNTRTRLRNFGRRGSMPTSRSAAHAVACQIRSNRAKNEGMCPSSTDRPTPNATADCFLSLRPQTKTRQPQTPTGQSSAFPDTPRDHLHVTVATRSVRKNLSDPCGTVQPGRIPRQARFIRRQIVFALRGAPSARGRSRCAREFRHESGMSERALWLEYRSDARQRASDSALALQCQFVGQRPS
jgi:hypothetical protein